MTRRAYIIALVLLVALGGLYLGLRYMKGAVIADLAYGSDPRNRIDVYEGSNCPAEGCPVLLIVHGGGWTGGDKSGYYHSGVAVALSRRGLTVMVANYRLAPTHKHPAQVEDVAAATAWAYQYAAQYNGNPERIFLLGHSAGAHLVSLVATNDYYLGRYGYKPSQLAGVISLDTGSLDLERRMRIWGGDDAMRTNTFPAGTERSASPFWNVREGNSYPPFLLIAASDNSEPIRQAGAMAAKLLAVGAYAQSAIIPYAGSSDSHSEIVRDLADSNKPVAARISSFIASPF